MIVLDTNVVSEVMKPEPHPAVLAWLNDQSAETLYLSSVTLAELFFGIGALPNGKRKELLTQTLDGLMKRSKVGYCHLIPNRHAITLNWPLLLKLRGAVFRHLMATLPQLQHPKGT